MTSHDEIMNMKPLLEIELITFGNEHEQTCHSSARWWVTFCVIMNTSGLVSASESFIRVWLGSRISTFFHKQLL